ncbi:calcium homeostasis modulator protein 6 [Notolabrus celidotus]|uniref:calcium homeostasis modulator protein 6 n=1 Tax=Notolabrus celidotus TaxID=1203425 RepID=UPI00148FEE7A|nr:calcium homeostasis modulator protein 6 [Notolabrus celidotus]
MDKFKTVLNIANQHTNLGFGVVALLTAGGEQIFSSVVFRCPCSPELNFMYGMVFLLVPALALLLFGYILSKKTWRLVTGLCRNTERSCGCKRLSAAGCILFQISTSALVAPSSWIAVALLSGNYFECAMTGTNASSYYAQTLCAQTSAPEQCGKELFRFPCGKGVGVPDADREQVMLTLRAHSQILGWLVIASIMLFNLLLTCVARCSSPISYLQLKFWRAYTQEENSMMDSFTAKHAKELAERNLKSFFSKSLPADIETPSNRDWEKISSLYKFSSRKQFYSTLHRYVETCQEDDGGVVRMASVRSVDSTDVGPAVLSFVDDGKMSL